ncbi:hypothetical protein [Glycomyces sp. MUSA5-2]|uniref:hypothetical protein n=1 Tax=Glycomyces sp. MUSA5-2 TaxID=2053002 RepID=UPI00300855E1
MHYLDWNVGDRCKVRPVLTLPAGVRSHWKVRSPYRMTATIKSLQIARFGVVAIVILDQHTRLTIEGCDREQAFTLFALHRPACRCRGCRRLPHDRRSWPRPLRVWRWLKRTLTGQGRKPRRATAAAAAPSGD